jgi:cephalosporin-C deacetylase-like acetyl esterase
MGAPLRELSYTSVQSVKIGAWQILPKKHRETVRRKLPFSESSCSRLMLVVQREWFAKAPDYLTNNTRQAEIEILAG